MYTKLGDDPLKSGQTLEVGVVTAPDAEFAGAIQHLLVHKGPEWEVHIRAALRGETDQLETRFYVGLLDGVPAANVMTVETDGIGILGHVFTAPQQRRKGICQAIMRRLMEHFRERKGHVLLLSTGYESPPYRIYHSFGFRSLKGGFMRYDAPAADALEQRWFSVDAVRTATLAWRHWPLLGLLGAQTSGEALRSAAWKLFGMGSLEGPVVHTLAAQSEGRGTNGVVLEAGLGAVVGCATLHPTGGGTNGWPGVWLLDLFSHPDFASHYSEMLTALQWPSGKFIAYVDTGSSEKAAALERHGFEREGTLRGFLRPGPEPVDVWVYGRIVN